MEYDLVQQAIQQRDAVLAQEAFRQLDERLRSSSDPKEMADLRLGRAVLSGVLHRFDEAREDIRLAREQAAEEPDITLRADFISASLYDEEENWTAAACHLTEVLLKHRQRLGESDFRFMYEDIQQRRALDLARLNRFGEALPVLREVLSFQLTPEVRSVVLSNLGISSAKLEKYEDAKEFLLQACEMGVPREWEGYVHFCLAYTYAHLRLLEESRREFELCAERAVEYRLPLREIYNWLSRVCKGLGKLAEAEQYARLGRAT